MNGGKCHVCGLCHQSIGIEIRINTLCLLGAFYEIAEGWTVRTDILDAHRGLGWVTVRDRRRQMILSASVEKIREMGTPVDRFGGAILLKREYWRAAPSRIQEREQIKGKVENESNTERDNRTSQDERSTAAHRDSTSDDAAPGEMAAAV